jgi:hypothetical protein
MRLNAREDIKLNRRPQSPVIPIPMLDEVIHTDEHPYCEDPDCPCWHEWTEREAEAERRYIEAGMTESYDVLPWRYGDDW